MKNLKATNRFDKELFKMFKRGVNICDPEDYKTARNMLLAGEKIPESYRDHKLHGEFKGYRSLHINPDWVLVYRTDEENVYMQRTGTHSDIYGR
jgi:mRNA interferase YafQ